MFLGKVRVAILIFIIPSSVVFYAQIPRNNLAISDKPLEVSTKISLQNLLTKEEEVFTKLNNQISQLSERLEDLSSEELQELLAIYEKEEIQANKIRQLRKEIEQERKEKEKVKKKLFSGKFNSGTDFIVSDLMMEFVWVEKMNCWVSKYETTNSEYRFFKPDHNSKDYEEITLNDDRQPAVYVSYIDALLFAEWLTERERQAGRLPEGWAFRFPTGEEWTQLAQCGEDRKYPWGGNWPPEYGNYDTDTKFDDYRIEGYEDEWIVSCPVEKSGMNPWGLYGVGGNALEWTSQKKGLEYVVRGASWYHFNKRTIECKFKSNYHPEIRFESLGFRLLLVQ